MGSGSAACDSEFGNDSGNAVGELVIEKETRNKRKITKQTKISFVPFVSLFFVCSVSLFIALRGICRKQRKLTISRIFFRKQEGQLRSPQPRPPIPRRRYGNHSKPFQMPVGASTLQLRERGRPDQPELLRRQSSPG